MAVFANAHQEVIRLDISVQDLSLVQILYAVDHLLAKH
jgi:hypothetical protein